MTHEAPQYLEIIEEVVDTSPWVTKAVLISGNNQYTIEPGTTTCETIEIPPVRGETIVTFPQPTITAK